MSRFLKSLLLATVCATPAVAQDFGLGRPALPDEVAAWDTDIRPDGAGLPVGSGDVFTGEEVFAEQCAVCHGDFGEAVGRWPVLAGGQDTIAGDDPVKTIGSYWPYLSTVYDYVQRAMPFGDARSLSDDDVYAITAYILYVNDLVDEDFELSNDNFTDIRLPNEANFYMDDRPETEYAIFTGEPCMSDCKDAVEITSRARVLDVTPETEEAVAQPEVEVAAVAEASEAPDTMELDPELVAAGENAFKKCKACHQVGASAKNRTGPQLNGIIGRAAGTVDGFRYSTAMKAAAESGLIWTDETLAEFLAKPKTFIKGTKMSFAGFKKESDIQAVTAYLKSLGE